VAAGGRRPAAGRPQRSEDETAVGRRLLIGWKERAKLALIGSPLEGAARRVWQGLRGGGGLPAADALTARAIARSVRRDSNCVDVGAHAGDILEMLLEQAPEGSHYAFEPLPGYAAALRRKYRRRANVHVFDCALGDADGVTAFHHDRVRPAYSGLRPLRRAGDRGAVDVIHVAQRRLDDVIPEGVPIRFVKIDVEGAELLVLRGAMRLLARHRPVVLFEFGRSAGQAYGTDPAEVVNLFANLGMQISSLVGYAEGAAPLDRDEVRRQYLSGSNWYFVAHAEDGR
jgi:FkbM family methyltransferase